MTERTSPSPRTGLAALVPAIALMFVVVDLALRLTPLDLYSFRAWEPVLRGAAPDACFGPSRVYSNDAAYGDLAALGNHRSMRRTRRETFTTDAFGFRDPPDMLAAGPPDVVLFGDSFAVGCGVRDDETPAAELRRILGRRVYDAAGLRRPADWVRATLAKLRMTHGVVIYEAHERRTAKETGLAAPATSARPLTFPPIAWLRQLSRLRIVSEATRKRIQDDVVLPNPFARLAPALELRDGSTMLFHPDEIRSTDVDRLDEAHARELVATAREIATPDLRVVVLLVPNKYTVYGPLLADSPGDRESFARRQRTVERIVRDAGVEVVNVTDDLQRAAEAGLATGELVYRVDDTHWNPEGIRLAARRVADALNARK